LNVQPGRVDDAIVVTGTETVWICKAVEYANERSTSGPLGVYAALAERWAQVAAGADGTVVVRDLTVGGELLMTVPLHGGERHLIRMALHDLAVVMARNASDDTLEGQENDLMARQLIALADRVEPSS
jgi:hypothetical protein